MIFGLLDLLVRFAKWASKPQVEKFQRLLKLNVFKSGGGSNPYPSFRIGTYADLLFRA